MTYLAKVSRSELRQWRKQCERQIKRSLRDRLNYGFVYTYKPVLDDAPARIFNSMKAYRKWCQKRLPVFLGYGRK